MKKNIAIIIWSILLSITGCADFLDERPKDFLTKETFYQTVDQAVSNVNYLYRSGVPALYNASSAYAGPSPMLGGYVSGYFDSEYGGQEVVVLYSKNLDRTAVNIANQIDGVWDQCYKAINVANGAIKYIPAIDMSEEEANLLVGEAKFFRAMNYFYLIKMFGDIPLSLEPYESLEGIYLPRTPSVTVYNQIVSDLVDAVAVLPDAAFYQNENRITKHVANTLLANVYLQMSGYPVLENHYADALSAAKAVITSGKHSLTQHGNLTDQSAYNKLRTTDGLDESIYAFEFNSVVSTSGWWPTYSFPNAAAGWGFFKYAITANIYKASNGLFNMYDPAEDIRGQEKQFFFTKYNHPTNHSEIQLGELSNWYYYEEEAMLSTGRGTKDFNIYRYAEVLLIAAEAIAQTTGVTNEAAGYLAQIKARASLTGKTVAAYQAELMTLSKEVFIEEVWIERLREFPLEFKIWDDVLRTRRYPQFSVNKGTVTFINVVGAPNNWGMTFEEKDLLWPLSANEMQRNPELVQNPGYQE